MEKGQTLRKVYLPKGRWVLTMDGQVYEGKSWVTVEVKLDQFAAFVKEGSAVLEVFR